VNCCIYGCPRAATIAFVWRTRTGRELLLGVCEGHSAPTPPPGWVVVESGELETIRAAWAHLN
jgi:hypothetical protein